VPDKPEPALSLSQCDGLDGTPHYSRQRCRIVRIKQHDGRGYWVETVKALCLTHYNELRKSAEPRHLPE
jgi:hypothetical protein